jgi:DNA polymerase (family X)
MENISNKGVAKLLQLAASLLELKAESGFKISAYQRAARAVETMQMTVIEANNKGLLGTIQGIGSTMKSAIISILKEGTFSELKQLQAEIPKGVQEILNIKGLGAKKVQYIWLTMGIETIGELYYACTENRLAQEKGFGAKSQEAVKSAIQFMQNSQGKFHYARVIPLVQNIVNQLIELTEESIRIEITGEFRRKCEIIHQLDLLMDTQEVEKIATILGNHADFYLQAKDSQKLSLLHHASGLKIYIFFANHFEKDLFITSAAPEHLAQLGEISNDFSTENNFYISRNLQYIEPELREGRNEIELAKENKIPELIQNQDIKGVIHAHSTYSDGANTLKDMALACKQKGYEYLIISDHSKSAFYANGLSEGRIEVQHQEIEKLNKTLAPFKIFKGIESDILNDGSLDYEENVLKSFDCIIASVHSNLKMDKEKANRRLIRAIENPYTRILGHPTGRLLLSREGYPIDYEYIIDACAANKVIIELNANPLRLDLDWRYIQYALKKGVKISINPDAHSIAGIDDIQYGVLAARKGMLYKEMCFNYLNVNEMAEYLQK